MWAKACKSRYEKFQSAVFTVCGAFGFVAYLSYLIKLLFWPSGAGELFVGILGTAVAGIPLFFKNKFKEILPERLYAVLCGIYAYAMLFYTVTMVVLCVYVFSAGTFQAQIGDMGDDPVLVVYGAGIEEDRPGVTLKKRLDKTCELMYALPESVCIVSGGQGSDEIMPESAVMKNYLLEKGISEERIFVEDKSRNTLENIKNSVELIKKENMENRILVSVSNRFHIPRIELICSRLEVEGEFVLADDPNPFTMLPVMVREYMSYVKLFLFGTE